MSRRVEPLEETKIEVVFQPYGNRSKLPVGTTIMEAATTLGLDIASLCGGKGTCGKCKVKVQKGVEGLAPLTEKELKFLSEEEVTQAFRLACQTPITQPMIIFVPERSRVGKQRLQTEGLEVPVEPNPLVKKYFVELPPPTLHDPRSDEDRLLDTLEMNPALENTTVDYEVAKKLPITLREAQWRVTAVLFKEKIVAVEPGDTTDRCFGFAVDIGSTKLAGFLMNLNTGEVAAVAARMNPQIPLGEDVLSRITHAMLHGFDALNELHEAVVSGINDMIRECCKKTSIKTEEIYELNFVGNTAMQLLFLKLWPQYTALSPYTPVLRQGIDVEAGKLGLMAYTRANAHYVPVIGGFVGSDSVADLMAVDMLNSKDIIMDIDIGTNTEIAIGNRESTMIASCASGPAFEGMEIKHGMRAASGAIERVSIDPNSLETHYRTIEDTPPIGICGSGLIDAPAELLKAGIITTTGRFNKELAEETERVRKTPEGWLEFVIAGKDETATGMDITITQADVRELQKAKAAMRAGAEVLLTHMNIAKKDITQLYVAGAFGNYIDPESARIIGMYPEFPLEKIQFVGNTAGTGSRMCLLSKEMREYAERISKEAQYYELAVDPNFQSEYIKATFLPHQDLSRQPIVTEMLRKLGRI
ncbi:MAG: ASKHA domain-containing protein [Candidatus Bathyarchaeota archaeon]|nr:ASKHA domain-containing protein [Candidatus Bathyarchaeota archaeon]